MEERQEAAPVVRFNVDARLVGEAIDIKNFQGSEEWKNKVLNAGSDPLLVQLGEKQFVALASFGSIAFWDMTGGEIDDFLRKISSLIGAGERSVIVKSIAARFVDFFRNLPCRLFKGVELVQPTKTTEKYDFTDTLEITIGAAEAKFSFDEIELPDKELTPELREVLSCVPTQSVALERYERQVDPLINKLKPIARNIANSGKPGVGQKELLQFLGRIMLIDMDLVGTLSLLDKPDRTWYDDDFETYYDKLSEHYNMRQRFESLTTVMKTLTECDDTIRDVINIMRGNLVNTVLIGLEVTIVILILFETLVQLYPGLFHH